MAGPVVVALLVLLCGGLTKGLKLEKPFDLKVAHWSSENVLLGWEFKAPEGVNVKTIKFSINCKGPDGKFDIFDVRSEQLRLNLTKLKEDSPYTVEITAITDAGDKSDPESLEFRTLAVDWPSAKIEGNDYVSSDRGSMYYLVKWEIPENEHLDKFLIRICEDEICDDNSAEKSERERQYEVSDYYSDFTITVVALFKQPFDLDIQRSSETYKDKSAMGEPFPVKNLKKEGQDENIFHFTWEPPTERNGPISYYYAKLRNLRNATNSKTYNITDGTTSLKAPAPLQEDSLEFQITVTAVNYDKRINKEFESRGFEKSFEFKLNPPMGISVTNLKSDSISFTITPSKESPIYFHKVEVGSKSSYTKGKTGSFNGLKPYEEVKYSLKTCFSQEKDDIICSQTAYRNSIRSNVARPGEVDTLIIDFGSPLFPSIRWFEPKEPNGPIEGYVVTVVSPLDESEIIANKTVGSDTTSFKLLDGDINKSYKFIVTAYNRDLKTDELCIGEKSEILFKGDPSPGPSPDPSPKPSPDPSPDPSPGPSPDPTPPPSNNTVIFVSVAFAIVLLGGAGYMLYRRRSADPSTLTVRYAS